MEGLLMEEMNAVPFEPLPIRRRTLMPVSPNQYRVVGASGETQHIEATTAYEAYRLSGLRTAFKIERTSHSQAVVLDKGQFVPEAPGERPAAMRGGSFTDHPLDALRLRKNAIMSADELDGVMRALQQEAVDEAAAPASFAAPAAPVQVPLPVIEPEASAEPTAPIDAASLLTGVELHGDGFDEIVPVAAVKPEAAPKLPEKKNDAEMKAADNVQEQPSARNEHELSQEEVEKLLNG